MHRNAGKKADRHGDRKQIRDRAQTENSGSEKQKADHQRQSRSQHRVFGRAGHSQNGKTSGKDRRDGRIRATRQKAIASEHGEAQRACQKGEKADLRGEPAEPGGRHLLRNCDRGEGQARKEIMREELNAIRIQRTEHQPGLARARKAGIRGAGGIRHHSSPPLSDARVRLPWFSRSITNRIELAPFGRCPKANPTRFSPYATMTARVLEQRFRGDEPDDTITATIPALSAHLLAQPTRFECVTRMTVGAGWDRLQGCNSCISCNYWCCWRTARRSLRGRFLARVLPARWMAESYFWMGGRCLVTRRPSVA